MPKIINLPDNFELIRICFKAALQKMHVYPKNNKHMVHLNISFFQNNFFICIRIFTPPKKAYWIIFQGWFITEPNWEAA